jgi:ribosomal protein L7/L12
MTIQDESFIALRAEVIKLNDRVALLEREVKYLLEHTPGTYVDKPPLSDYPEVAALKRQGNIIEAIKLYRTQTNAGLAEAKDFVDRLKV